MDTQIGSRYELLEPVGRGSMGKVWRARTTDGEPVAIKVLRPELADDPSFVARFVQERSLLTRVEHPAVVRVRDLVVEGDRLALVMDLVEGEDLRDLLVRSAPLAPSAVAGLVAEVADGLEAIHAAGIVHRDIKPENVLVEASGGRARVTDFGISGLVEASATRMTKLLGTPEYLAPEVVERHPPTPAVDVYGLGIVLFELLAGVTPFAGGHELAVLERHRTARCPRLPWAPEALGALIDRMLAKDPGDRPTASEVAAELRAIPLGHLPPQPLLDPAEVAAQAALATTAAAGGGGARTRAGTVILGDGTGGGRVAEGPVLVAAPEDPPSRRRRPALVAVGVALAALVAALALTVGRNDGDEDAAPTSTTAETSLLGDVGTTTPEATFLSEPPPPSVPVPAPGQSEPPPGPPATAAPPATRGGSPAPPATSPPAPQVTATSAPPLPPPVIGQWQAVPGGLESCAATQRAGFNLYWQICWSGSTPMMVVRVTGISGQPDSPSHQVAVLRIWTVVNGAPSRGTSCPSRLFAVAVAMVCVDRTGPSGPGAALASTGRLLHDGIESSQSTSRT